MGTYQDSQTPSKFGSVGFGAPKSISVGFWFHSRSTGMLLQSILIVVIVLIGVNKKR